MTKIDFTDFLPFYLLKLKHSASLAQNGRHRTKSHSLQQGVFSALTHVVLLNQCPLQWTQENEYAAV